MSATGLGGLLPDLRWRGLVHATTDGLEARLAAGTPLWAYNGFEPTFRSLHVGHLITSGPLPRELGRGQARRTKAMF